MGIVELGGEFTSNTPKADLPVPTPALAEGCFSDITSLSLDLQIAISACAEDGLPPMGFLGMATYTSTRGTDLHGLETIHLGAKIKQDMMCKLPADVKRWHV